LKNIIRTIIPKRENLPIIVLMIVSALLLTVIQAPLGWSFLAWGALVPLVLACTPQLGPRSLALIAFVVGYLYWLVNVYWIVPITVIGWLGMGLYLSLFWVLPALAVRFCRAQGFPLFLALPLLIVGAERLQGFPMGGFYWRFLGHSQYQHLALIQVADLFGAAGVSFVVAMVNGLLVDLILRLRIADFGLRIRVPALIRNPQSSIRNQNVPSGRNVALGAVLTVLVVAGTVLYGQWRLRQTGQYVTDGPLVGSLQSNVPQSVKQSFSHSQELFEQLMSFSKAAAAAGAELIVWPETMVQAFLEPALWPHLADGCEEDKAFHQALCEHAKGTASLLVGAHGAEIVWPSVGGKPYLVTYNSAYFYRPDGTRDPGRYDKIHLVLFGEYIPFKRWFPGLFEYFMPEGYHPSLTLEPGRNYTLFEMKKDSATEGQEQHGLKPILPDAATPPNPQSAIRNPQSGPAAPYRFGVIICYEDTIPYVGRNFALDEQGRKRIDWLVNISNDGWFVRFPEGRRVIPSTELPQHAAICVFRAVENRLAIIRSVNTGVSCLIESTGRIRDGYLAAGNDFPHRAMERTAMAGWFLDRLPIDTRVTVYSRHGEWFADGGAAVFVAALAGPLGTRLVRRQRQRRSA